MKCGIIDRLGVLADSDQAFPWITTAFLILVVLILIALPLILEGNDANILNGAAIAAFITFLTTQALV